jgi:pyridoxal phosphate enzyme (YggS family)
MDHDDVAAGLEAVKARIAKAAAAAGREPRTVTLVAITKTHASERIEPALRAGHRVYGENRVQEAMAKWPGLRARYPDLELHLVGPLQTNKVPEAIGLFDVIQTVDRERLAAAIAAASDRAGRRPRCFVQVNTGEEPQKAGIAPGDADGFIEACRVKHRLDVIGLMCIPPQAEPPAPHFALLAKIAAQHGLAALSMGMSADFETAIRFGATHIRVGTAIFGSR